MNESKDHLLTKLRSVDSAERKVALVCIARARPQGVLSHVVAVLTDDDNEVRSTAAWALDQLGDPDAVPALIVAIHDRAFDVRSNAGWALVHLAQRLTPHLVVPDMIDVLRDDTNFDARQMAWLVLERIGGEEARDAINRYWL